MNEDLKRRDQKKSVPGLGEHRCVRLIKFSHLGKNIGVLCLKTTDDDKIEGGEKCQRGPEVGWEELSLRDALLLVYRPLMTATTRDGFEHRVVSYLLIVLASRTDRENHSFPHADIGIWRKVGVLSLHKDPGATGFISLLDKQA